MKIVKFLVKIVVLSLLLASCNVSSQARYAHLNKVPRNEMIISNNVQINKINNQFNNLGLFDIDKIKFDSISQIPSNTLMQNGISNNKINKVTENKLIKNNLLFSTKITAKHSYSQIQELNNSTSINWIISLILQVLVLALLLTILGYILPVKVFNWVLSILLILFLIYLIFYLLRWL